MLQDVSAIAFQFYDVSFRHNHSRIFFKHILGICTHVAMELAFRSDLINAIDVIVHLVRHQLLNDLNTSDLSKNNIRKYWWLAFVLVIRITFVLIIFGRDIINNFVLRIKVAKLLRFIFVGIKIYPCEPRSTLGHISYDQKIVAIYCGILDPKLEA